MHTHVHTHLDTIIATGYKIRTPRHTLSLTHTHLYTQRHNYIEIESDTATHNPTNSPESYVVLYSHTKSQAWP